MTAIVPRRGRLKNITRDAWSGYFDLLDHEFDDGADETIALIRHEIEMHGAAPLHPDGIVYDPMPPIGTRREFPRWQEPPPPPRPPRHMPDQPIVSWLPGNFQWLITQDRWISQAEIEAFWIEHRGRFMGTIWSGWPRSHNIEVK